MKLIDDFLYRIAQNPAHYAIRLSLLFAVFFVVVVFLFGCAQIPSCDKFQYHVVPTDDGAPLYVLDEMNAVKLVRLVEGLSNGTCRLPE